MKRCGWLLAAGLLALGGSAVRAGEAAPIPGTLNLAPLTPVPAQPCCGPATCTARSRCCGSHWDRVCDWLMYKPPSCHACCCVVSNCNQPLYVFFLEMCQGCGRGGCGHGCAAGGCDSNGCEHLGFPQVETAPSH
jgi:hypothetical protein